LIAERPTGVNAATPSAVARRDGGGAAA